MGNIFGSVIGDIVGSIYEVYEVNEIKNQRRYEDRIKILNKGTNLFLSDCSFTDDSILTTAIANAILTDNNYEKNIYEFGQREISLGMDKYGRSRFGGGFLRWLNDKSQNGSYGNGCAMRISPIGYAFDSLEKTLVEAEKSCICTHNHPDSIKCSRATAGAVYLSRCGQPKEVIKNFVEKELGFKLEYNLEFLQRYYKFSSKAINSVPQAIYCFLISNSYEDCLRKSISIGGDCDTIASISCGIAGAFYGVPQKLINEAKKFIPDNYLKIINQFNQKFIKNAEKI